MTTMPTILRVGPYRFYFYSYDCGEPRHTPGDRDNCTAKFWLDPDASLLTNHGYSPRELRSIERIVRENLESLRNNGTNSAVVTLARVLKVEVTDDTLSIDLEDGRSFRSHRVVSPSREWHTRGTR
jgi:hypothetical protein